MGRVAITLTVTPEGPEADLESIKKEIISLVRPQDIKEVPIGFGLVSLKVMIIRDDKQGGDTDALEAELGKIKNVGSVRTDDVTLI